MAQITYMRPSLVLQYTVCLILQGEKVFKSLCVIIGISSTLLDALEIYISIYISISGRCIEPNKTAPR